MGWALLLFFCILWVSPLRVEARADINRRPTLHAVLRVWGFRPAYDIAVERRETGLHLTVRRQRRKPTPKPDVEGTLQEVRKAVRLLKKTKRARAFLQEHIDLESLSLEVRLGTQDAAWTTFLCGACMMVAGSWMAARGRDETMRVRIVPEHRALLFLGSVDCIITCRVGHIIGGAVLGVGEVLWHRCRILLRRGAEPAKRGENTWNGIRSKA